MTVHQLIAIYLLGMVLQLHRVFFKGGIALFHQAAVGFDILVARLRPWRGFDRLDPSIVHRAEGDNEDGCRTISGSQWKISRDSRDSWTS